jgi:HD superfamily phosphohydrolase
MEIRDPVHGSIGIASFEEPIIEHPFFQRLRNILQLGLSEFAFPGATHTRYLHSIGVSHLATQTFDKIFLNINLPAKEKARLRMTLRLAALLHDVGHAPLSHSTECVMPLKKQLSLPKYFESKDNERATHEDYTLLAITNSSFTESFNEVKSHLGVEPLHIACLIRGIDVTNGAFTVDHIDYFPVLHQLISSELDCDRMDYLLRDSYFCGVSYGKFDFDWIVDNLHVGITDKKAFLALSERALATFDDFLLSRFHMFLMVYFHYRAVCLEQMLYKYFTSKDNAYHFPTNIEDYIQHDDHYLTNILRQSQNKWAKKIVKNDIPEKIFETFSNSDEDKFLKLTKILEKNKLDFIVCESSGRLSKYYSENHGPSYPLMMKKQYPTKDSIYVAVSEATQLYKRYSEAHAVKRLHVDLPFHESWIKEVWEIIKA